MTKYELVGKIMSLGAENKGKLPSSKMAAKDEAVKLLDEYLALNIPNVSISVCDHHWYNTGTTIQRNPVKQCAKCGQTEC